MTRPRTALALALLAAALVGCGSVPGRRSLSFSQMQMLNRGLSAEWIYTEFPGARVQRWPDGTIRRLEYSVTDPEQKGQTLYLEFDRSGTMTRKQYTGRIVRPPPQ